MSSVELMLNDQQWEWMRPYLPGRATDPGRTGADCRLFAQVVLCLVRTGVPWRDPPHCFGNCNSVFDRFSRWSKDGARDRLFAARVNDQDFEYIMIDFTIVRVHVSVAAAAHCV